MKSNPGYIEYRAITLSNEQPDRDFKETAFENMEWVHLAQDRAQWQVLVSTSQTPLCR